MSLAGDLDLIVGDYMYSTVAYFENAGTATAPAFVQRTGTANLFDGLSFEDFTTSTPTLVDLDNDGTLTASVDR